jgi:uncharacterized protein (DUF2461 family)
MKMLGQEVFKAISGEYANYGFIHKLSRIYKDARRVRDGKPYRESLWFSVEKPAAEEWTSLPVFWFEVGPDGWSYGLGFAAAKAVTMAKFRARIDNDTKRFEKLIAPLDGQNEFIVSGDEYARKKEAPTEKTKARYNRKTLSLMHAQDIGGELFSPDLAGRITNGFRFLMPFYDYFVTIDGDPQPK